LLPIAFVAYRTLRDFTFKQVRSNLAERRKPRSLALPPNALIFSATATKDVRWFLTSGEQTVASFRSALEGIGRPLESFRAVLDLGCGCGRVLRHWEGVNGPSFTGTDYNPAGVRWAKQNLPFVTFAENQLTPPLPFAAANFDLVYAVSVFTHLPAEIQRPWIEELHRIIEPSGVLMLTLSGEGDLIRVGKDHIESFEAGNLVVVDATHAGTNLCGAYHPREYVERNWSDLFRILAVYPQGAGGVPKQDLYVFERLPGQ
jgi:SAM-dependent methyltransferase